MSEASTSTNSSATNADTAAAAATGGGGGVADEEYDPLRDGPLRYLGYANEVGEAFRGLAPALVVRFTLAVER